MVWSSKKLSEVCMQIFAGGDVPKDRLSKYQTEDYLVPIFSNGEKNKGLYGYTDVARVHEASITVSARGTIGYSEIRYEPFLPVVRLIVLTPDTEIVTIEFLRYAIKGLEFVNSGSSIPQLTVPMIKGYELTLPPIPEQKRIVAILDQAFADIDKARANAEQNLKNARELFDSYLQQVFSQRGDGWVETTLGEAVIVERGSSPRPIKSFITDDDAGVNWVKIGDVAKGAKYVESTNQKITAEGALKSRFVDVGDFILSNSMSFGRPYIMAIQGYIHDGWFVLRLPEAIDTDFFYLLLSSPYLNNQFIRLAAGAIVKNISGDLVKKAIIPLPPLRTQKRMAIELDAIALKITNLENIYIQKLDSLDELKKSILQKAFSGELTKNKDIAA